MSGFPGIPRSTPPNIAKILEDLKERAEIGEGQRGPPLQAYVKKQDLIDLGLARLISIGPGGAIIQNPGAPNLTTPPAPTGFTVTNGFSHVFTEWDSPYDAYSNHARTRIYRATEDNLANAVEVGQSTGFAFADLSVQTGTVYYYWCRWESASGVLGPFNDTVGTPGQRSEDPGEILDRLIGQIRETHLYQDLNDRIDLIDAPDTGLIYLLADETAARIADAQALNDALVAETNARLAAILSVINQINDANVRILAAETDITNLQVSVTDLETGVAGNASALSFLTSRVTATENSITSQGTAITQLQADLTDAEAAIAGNASAVSTLDARVTITENSITSQASQIAQVSADVEDLNLAVTGNATALSSLDARVTSAEGTITSQAGQLTTLQSAVSDLEGDVLGNSSAITSLTTRVTATENSISSQSTAITELQAAVADIETGGSGTASAISLLDARVTANEGEITSLSSDITTLENSVSTLNGAVTGNTTAVNSLTTRMTTAEGTISGHSSQLTQLQVDVSNAQADADAAASAATALDARVDATEASIASQSTQLTELIADVDDLGSDLAGQSTSISNLDARVTSAEGNITSQGSAISSLQSSVADLNTNTSANASAISSLNTNVTSINGTLSANSTSITQLNARLNSFGGSGVSVEQKFEASANEIDGLFGQYTLKLDADGHIAGFGLSIETANSGETTSNFIVNADRFAIVSSDTTKIVTNQSVVSGVMTVTTSAAHNMIVGDDVKFVGIEEELWKGEVLSVASVPSPTTFTIAVPGGFPTPVTARIKGNRKAINTLTRSGTVATATFAAAHGISVGGTVDITNANQSGWNGKWVVTGVSGNNVTFTVPNTLTTPATASVKVAKLAIPFVVADNRVVMDGAFIKNATITDAQIGSVSVEKITGLNATFIQANINQIDAFEIDVVNLTAQNINGDIQRVSSVEFVGGSFISKDAFQILDTTFLDTPIGSSGHRLSLNLSGHFGRGSAVGLPPTPLHPYIALRVKIIPASLAGATSLAISETARFEEGVTDPYLRFPLGAFNSGETSPMPSGLERDIQSGDILQRNSDSANFYCGRVEYVREGAAPNRQWVLRAYAAAPDSYAEVISLSSSSFAYTRYRPSGSYTGGTYWTYSHGIKNPSYNLTFVSPQRYQSPVIVQLLGCIYDSDGEAGAPAGSSSDYWGYSHVRGYGLVFGLR